MAAPGKLTTTPAPAPGAATPGRAPHERRGAAAPARGHIRKLMPAERRAVTDHLLRLDPLSRFMRFGGVTSDALLARHAARLFSGDALAVGWFVDGRLRAVAELHPLPVRAGRAAAEAAFSVERAYQGQGVGSAMMRQLFLLAANRGITELRLVFLPGNGAMKRLAVRYHADLSIDEEEVVGRMAPPAATVFSRLREQIGDAFAVAVSAFEMQAGSLPAALRGT